ncbi:MAG: NAD(P)H-dependent oxidoreductase [Pleurocapsa sp.]
MNDAIATPEQILQQLHWRYATKKFDPAKKIPEAVWQVLEQSLVFAPSSFGLQPWKFFVIRNPEIRQQLFEHSAQQSPVVDASHLVVFALKKDVDSNYVDSYIKRTAAVRKVSVDDLQGFANVIKGFLANPPAHVNNVNFWSAKQAYIALGFFLTCAATLKVDTLPMEGFIPAKCDEILGLSAKGYASVVLCAAGYRADDDKYAILPKVRFATEDVVDYI